MILSGAINPELAAGAYWLKYTAAEMLNILQKYGKLGSYLTAAYSGITTRESMVKIILGKWLFYFRGGFFPNTPDGRRAASSVIAADISKQYGAISGAEVYQVIQNINAALIKDLKAPTDRQGTESEAERKARRKSELNQEIQNRKDEVIAAVNPLNLLKKSPILMAGIFALVAGIAFLKFKK